MMPWKRVFGVCEGANHLSPAGESAAAPPASPPIDNGGALENAQAMAAHESPRTTKLYDRRGDEITLDEVERIAI